MDETPQKGAFCPVLSSHCPECPSLLMISPSRISSTALATALLASAATVLFHAVGPVASRAGAVLEIGLPVLSLLGLAWFAWNTYSESRLLRYALRQLAQQPAEVWPDLEVSRLNVPSGWKSTLQPLLEAMRSAAERLVELEQQQLQQRFRHQQAPDQSLERFLESLPDPVLLVDAQGRLALANRSARRVLDMRPEEELPAPLDQLDAPWLVRLLEQVGTHRVPGTASAEVQLQVGGTPHWYKATATSFGTPEAPQVLSAVSVILHDLTPLRTIQQRHAEFVSAVSHEMKAPLSGIRAYTEMLLDGEVEDAETLEEFLRVIDSQADRLRRLIENLLNLARIEAGVVQVEKKIVPLNDVLEEAVRVLMPTAEEKGIQVRQELSPMCLRVLGDRDQLLQAAINLVSNAIKYTHEGGWVAVRSRSRGEQVQFEVEDSGVGMTPEECQRVFDKFYRIKKNNHMASGTGLGLPLVKSIIVDLHGGHIRVESNPGQGTIFIIELPAAPSRAAYKEPAPAVEQSSA